MPSIASLHPILVHFAIALLFAGVAFRLVSLSGRAKFTGPAAAALILAGTLGAVLSAKSGRDAHGPVEHMPGSGEALARHQAWGFRTRNVFLGVAAIEVGALWLARRNKEKIALVASAALGLGGLFCLYQAGRNGGVLVYSYAGGVGVRSGSPKDVDRLLLAGLVHAAEGDRRAGRPEGAAALMAEAGRRFPDDPEVQCAVAESLLADRRDAAGALAILEKIEPKKNNRGLRMRRGLLRADALEALGRGVEARAALEEVAREFPDAKVVKKRLERAGMSAPK